MYPVSVRYNGQEGYVEAVRAAAEDLVDENLMLAEDVELVIDAAPTFPTENPTEKQ
ncbi:hypothetical protein [Halomonas jincaotanensis]|uniref:hypothetical protein n=1 Tax=Halomonas jincaotanensis TaxID=2810616 RepID=UPI001BD6AFB4|nr:hypothetical protein [Halomonas jincaotanensis]